MNTAVGQPPRDTTAIQIGRQQPLQMLSFRSSSFSPARGAPCTHERRDSRRDNATAHGLVLLRAGVDRGDRRLVTNGLAGTAGIAMLGGAGA
jgi:hypothetical protein